MTGHVPTPEPSLIDRLAQLDDRQRLRFFEQLALDLTVVNRVICADEESTSEAKVERLKNVNEILHRVVCAVSTVRESPREWSDAVMVGEIRRWITQDESIAGDVGWAIQRSIARALMTDQRQGPATRSQPGG